MATSGSAALGSSREPGPQGIALAVGMAAASHLEVVWALLERLGRDRFLGSQDSQVGGARGDPEGLAAWRVSPPALSLSLLPGLEG